MVGMFRECWHCRLSWEGLTGLLGQLTVSHRLRWKLGSARVVANSCSFSGVEKDT